MSYGDLTHLDTSQVTSFYQMFYQVGNDSSVTSFELIGLDNWDTSKVTDMNSMFYLVGSKATTWTIGDLSNWDTSKVTTMYSMFDRLGYSATTWTIGDLSNWDTSKVANMDSMFMGAGYSTMTWSVGDLSTWNTSSVTDMSDMFSQAGRNATTWSIGDLSNWDVSQVVDVYAMFSEAGKNSTTFELDLSNWDTSSVATMSSMFYQAGYSATTFNIGNLSNWDTSKVASMKKMFYEAGYNAPIFELDLSNWDASSVTNMSGMFHRAGYNAATWSIGDLSNWDTSKATDMSTMFSEAGNRATTWVSIGTLKVYDSKINSIFSYSTKAKATLNILSVPTDYNSAFTSAVTASDSLITLNYNCTTAGVVNDIIATKSSNSNVVKGTNLEGTCPDRTINVVVNNGTVNTSSTTVPNLGSATFNLTPTSGYSNPRVSCTNGQNGSMSGNTLTVSNVVSDTTCTVTYYISEAITLTENDATYPWIETSGVWKSGNYNVNSSTSTITLETFTLTNGGSVSFDWAVSSESATSDYLYYTIYKDGTAVSGTGTSTKIGGNDTITEEANLSYTTVSKELEAGTYTIAFSYRKDGSVDKGLDRGYVKNIFVLK